MRYHSHIGQDRWVLETLNFRRDAYFLEFGAFDGISSSNTLTLERDFGWSGIVVEANPTYYPEVCKNRRCITINAALWEKSRQELEMIDAHGLSSVASRMDFDGGQKIRAEISKGLFKIDTINPTELLRRFNAPQRIEYLSLDVEGCEFDVLKSIDFDYYQIAMLSIEHSHVPSRQNELRSFMLPRGYSFYERFYDDWYFHPGYLAQLQLINETFDPESAFRRVCENFTVV